MTDQLVQFAQKAFIIHDNKLLIIKKNNRDPIHRNKWEVPGGRKMMGETLDESIIREVKEEIGLEIIPADVFDIWSFQHNLPHEAIAVARFCKLKTNSAITLENCIAEHRWVALEKNLTEIFEFNCDILPTMKKLSILTS
jgi:mutator protein MutT